MIDLNKEAEKYGNLFQGEYDNIVGYMEGAYMKGATSKYVKQQILQAQLKLLRNFYYGEDLKDDHILDFYVNVYNLTKQELEQELKQLQDE